MNIFANEDYVLKTLSELPKGKNTSFLKASHSLWKRFKNYEKNPPFTLLIDEIPVAFIFATTSERTKYINLYEIVTVQGQEGKGYGRKIWSDFVLYWSERGMQRIKISCTPDSIGFHAKNGLVFWSVDKQGSLRSDQPLMSSVKKQIELRNKAKTNPSLVRPEQKVCEKLKKEDLELLSLSEKKLMATFEAINKVQEFWLRRYLFENVH